MTYRVIQWSTGHVGHHALRGILTHPDLEIAGLIVHSEEKAGRDAGELAGLDPVGVRATTDPEEALGTGADVVCYTATGDLRPHEAVADMCRALEAGSNVVASSVVSLCYPPAADPSMVQRLEEACRHGGSTCFTSGIDPGLANDLLPILLTGLSQRIESVRIQEILNYTTYDQGEVLFTTMGFGQPLDAEPLLLLPGSLTFAWGPIVQEIAAALGTELDEVRQTHERVPAPETFTISTGTVEEGTTAGIRFEIQGIVAGRPAIVIEHVTRLRDDVAPHWPQGKGYRITIDGEPRISCELQMEASDGDENTAGLIVTAMRLLNAIPAVCAAEPGVLSALDIPLTPGRHLLS